MIQSKEANKSILSRVDEVEKIKVLEEEYIRFLNSNINTNQD